MPENASTDELRALLGYQRLEMEGLKAGLEAQKLADRMVVPDMRDAALLEFQGRSRLPQ